MNKKTKPVDAALAVVPKAHDEVRAKIKELEKHCSHVLTGSLATIQINAPRALMQISAEEKLKALYWVLGEKYVSKLKGTNT